MVGWGGEGAGLRRIQRGMRERKREEEGNGVLQLCRIKGYVSEHMGGGGVSTLVLLV